MAHLLSFVLLFASNGYAQDSWWGGAKKPSSEKKVESAALTFRVPVTGDGAREALAKLEAVEKVEIKEGVAAITLKKKSTLALTAIEKAVKVDREKLTLDGKAALKLSGMTCESCTTTLRDALKIDGVSDLAVADPKKGIVHGTFKGVAYGVLTKAIKKTPFTFDDVVWASCCGSCKPGQDCAACGMKGDCGSCAKDCDRCASGKCGSDCPKCGSGWGSKGK